MSLSPGKGSRGMFKIILHKKAAKYYQKLDDKAAKRVNLAIEEIGKGPINGPHVKRLRGRLEGKYRYDVDGLRIIYVVNPGDETVIIEAIGPRGDIYK